MFTNDGIKLRRLRTIKLMKAVPDVLRGKRARLLVQLSEQGNELRSLLSRLVKNGFFELRV